MKRIEIDASSIGRDDVVVFEIGEGERISITHPNPFDVTPRNFWGLVQDGVATEAILVVCATDEGGIRKVHHARRVRRDAGPVKFLGSVDPKAKPYGYYRQVLKHQLDVPPTVQTRISFGMTLVYGDETIVPAFATNGTFGWLLTEEHKAEIRQAFPPLRPTADTIKVGVMISGRNTGTHCYGSQNWLANKEWTFFAPGTPCPERVLFGEPLTPENGLRKVVFEAEIDAGNGKVLGLRNEEGLEVKGVALVDPSPMGGRTIVRVGNRLPGYLFAKAKAVATKL